MKRLNKKVKAFTIAEMLVVLVISGIVISLTMLILNLVQKQINAIQTNYELATEIRLLESVLVQDFNQHNLFYDHAKQQLYCISPIDTIHYTFDANYVIRNADTLNVSISNTVLFLDGEKGTSNSVDAIELDISSTTKKRTLFVSQRKDASFYINDNGI